MTLTRGKSDDLVKKEKSPSRNNESIAQNQYRERSRDRSLQNHSNHRNHNIRNHTNQHTDAVRIKRGLTNEDIEKLNHREERGRTLHRRGINDDDEDEDQDDDGYDEDDEDDANGVSDGYGGDDVIEDTNVSKQTSTPTQDEMMKLMGFASFDTTKNKHVDGIGKGVAKKNKKSQFRQYMNREKGFNRALSPERKNHKH